jgi:regulator of sigma E protease
VTTTEGFGETGVLALSAGTPSEEIFEFWRKNSDTIILADRALGDTLAQSHPAGAPIERQVDQGPTGITIAPAYGSIEPIPPEELATLEEEVPEGISIPTTVKVPFSETQWEWPWQALQTGVARSFESLVLARNEIESRFRGGISGGGGGFQVTGPVGIAQLTGEVVDEAGWKSLMEFAALISMNLALLNILPLPMLDGGRIVFVLIEIVRGGRRIAPEREAVVHFVGLVAMLAFAVVITYFDVLRIFEGEGVLR